MGRYTDSETRGPRPNFPREGISGWIAGRAQLANVFPIPSLMVKSCGRGEDRSSALVCLSVWAGLSACSRGGAVGPEHGSYASERYARGSSQCRCRCSNGQVARHYCQTENDRHSWQLNPESLRPIGSRIRKEEKVTLTRGNALGLQVPMASQFPLCPSLGPTYHCRVLRLGIRTSA
jgi:hypothetical protein